jgi:hypothetical protein
MKFCRFAFGCIEIDGTTYDHDVIIDHGEILKRKKKPSKRFQEEFGHTSVSRRKHTMEVQAARYRNRSVWQASCDEGSQA